MINILELEKYCSMKKSNFRGLGENIDNSFGELIYIDNHSKILGIAHLDTVQLLGQKFDFFNDDLLGKIVFSPYLDDRLGVYILLSLLPGLGLDFDVLLTDCEESLNSTASWFNADKKYNWIFQFDRAGRDTVNYQYGDKKFDKLLKKYQFELGIGSYTDICEIDKIGVKAFNIGCGYYDNHSANAYMVENDLSLNIKRFRRFFLDNKNKRLKHDYQVSNQYGWKGYYSRWGSDNYTWQDDYDWNSKQRDYKNKLDDDYKILNMLPCHYCQVYTQAYTIDDDGNILCDFCATGESDLFYFTCDICGLRCHISEKHIYNSVPCCEYCRNDIMVWIKN